MVSSDQAEMFFATRFCIQAITIPVLATGDFVARTFFSVPVSSAPNCELFFTFTRTCVAQALSNLSTSCLTALEKGVFSIYTPSHSTRHPRSVPSQLQVPCSLRFSSSAVEGMVVTGKFCRALDPSCSYFTVVNIHIRTMSAPSGGPSALRCHCSSAISARSSARSCLPVIPTRLQNANFQLEALKVSARAPIVLSPNFSA